jgi:ferredoxin
MSLYAEIDENACAAHGDCVDLAPEVFVLEDVARVVGQGPDDLLMAAAEACPSAAIRVLNSDGGRQIYP